jgi:hypothetical protein
MQAIFHYDAGPRLKARFTTLAAAGFEIDSCPEENGARLAALLPEAWLTPEMLDRSLNVAVDNMRRLRARAERRFRIV